jgi:hypothetical protein
MKTIETTNRLPLIATLSVLIRVALIAGLLALAGVLKAQDINNENFVSLNEFTKIEIAGAFDVTLIQSDVHKISKNENADVIFEVKNGELGISHRDRRQNRREKEVITIYFKSLEELELSGAVSVNSESLITGNLLKLEMSGANNVTLNVEFEKIISDLSGASRLTLSGTANTHQFEASGASSVNAESLKTESTIVEISGASSANVNAEIIRGEVGGVSKLTHNPEAKNEVDRSRTASVRIERELERAQREVERAQERSQRENGIIPTKKTRKSIWNPKYGALDLGWSGYGQDFFRNTLPEGYDDMKLKGNTSFAVNLNAFRYAVSLHNRHYRGKDRFAIGTGFGIGWNIYKFLEPDMIPRSNRENRQFVIEPYAGTEDRTFRRSKLQSSWLKVPLYLQYENRDFFMTAGVVGNIRIGASTKQVFDLNGSRQRQKTRDNFYLSAFRADAELRVGYKSTSLFATYSLTPMFIEGRGPELNTFTFGVSLGVNVN